MTMHQAKTVNGVTYRLTVLDGSAAAVLETPYCGIPKGYTWDGATIPTAFGWLGHPLDSIHIRASLMHDWAYDCGRVERDIADREYLDNLIEDGQPAWKAFLEYAAVRLFGARHYNRFITGDDE